MIRRRKYAVLVALSALILASTGAFAEDEWAPEEMTGIKIGEKAPDFTLESFDGKQYTLSDLVKKAPVALVFYRSALW